MKIIVATDNAQINPIGGLNKGFPLFRKRGLANDKLTALTIPCMAAGISKLPEQ